MVDLLPGIRGEQVRRVEEIEAFARAEVAPFGAQIDQEEWISSEVLHKIRSRAYWAPIIPKDMGGEGMDMVTYGFLSEEFGKASASVQILLNVQCMVAHALCRWGDEKQKRDVLPRLADGNVVAAFGLTEPDVGSNAKNVKTRATPSGSHFVLDGVKRWITGAQIADLFLILANCEGQPTAFLVRRDTPGLDVVPISGLLGLRGSMTAEVRLSNCLVPKEDLVGRPGIGFSHVVACALDLGRYSVAWGAVGLGQACLEASRTYAQDRRQFDVPIKEHQLIQQMITNMVVNVKAARLLCLNAGLLRDQGDPQSILDTNIAKYFASTMVTRVSSDAVQIHGANGCGMEYPVQRYFRDARVMEIIEGSTQIQQILISRHASR